MIPEDASTVVVRANPELGEIALTASFASFPLTTIDSRTYWSNTKLLIIVPSIKMPLIIMHNGKTLRLISGNFSTDAPRIWLPKSPLLRPKAALRYRLAVAAQSASGRVTFRTQELSRLWLKVRVSR